MTLRGSSTARSRGSSSFRVTSSSIRATTRGRSARGGSPAIPSPPSGSSAATTTRSSPATWTRSSRPSSRASRRRRRIKPRSSRRTGVAEVFNLLHGEMDAASDRSGYVWRRAKVRERLGATLIRGSVYELGEDEKTFPYHFHHGVEDWLLVVAGAPTLRTPDGERALRPGDV